MSKLSLTIHFDSPEELEAYLAGMGDSTESPAPAKSSGKGRGRPKKDAEPEPKAEPSMTVDELVEKAKKMASEGGSEMTLKIREINAKHGIKKMSECPADKIDDVFADLEAAHKEVEASDDLGI